MGMLFNTKATNRMLEIINAAFSSENWDFWFQPMADQTIPKDLFKETDASWPLHKIAKKVGIFGPDGEVVPRTSVS